MSIPPGFPKYLNPASSGRIGTNYVGYPISTDLDYDGKLDIVVSAQNNFYEEFTYVFNTGIEINNIEWSGYLNDERHQGAYLGSLATIDVIVNLSNINPNFRILVYAYPAGRLTNQTERFAFRASALSKTGTCKLQSGPNYYIGAKATALGQIPGFHEVLNYYPYRSPINLTLTLPESPTPRFILTPQPTIIFKE